MRCLFCKQNSSNAKSVEHIVPESLGNNSQILKRGRICDKCNNYIARKIEKPFLEQYSIRLLRFEEGIPNKKGMTPEINGIIGNELVAVQKKVVDDNIISFIDMGPDQIKRLLKCNNLQTLILPAFNETDLPPNNSITSRFIAKIALESLSERMDDESCADYLIDNPQFDAIRNHVRYGLVDYWPCSIRRIYSAKKFWNIDKEKAEQIVFESDFLLPNINESDDFQSEVIQSELYFIMIIWGIEYAINLGGPEIEGYENWLIEHGGLSPLYYGKNK